MLREVIVAYHGFVKHKRRCAMRQGCRKPRAEVKEISIRVVAVDRKCSVCRVVYKLSVDQSTAVIVLMQPLSPSCWHEHAMLSAEGI